MLSDIERVYDILELTYIDISTKDGLDRLEKLKIGSSLFDCCYVYVMYLPHIYPLPIYAC